MAPSQGTRPSPPRARISTNGDGQALLGAVGELLVLGERELAARERRDRAHRRHLGHAPGVRDVEAVALARSPRSSPAAPPRRRRSSTAAARGPTAPARRRAAAGSPSRSSARPAVTVTSCSTNASSSDDGIEVRPREDLLRADERAREREAPGVRVEHRHDGQHDVGLGDPERARLASTRASGSRSRDASRRRPSAARSCRSCNTSPRPSARRCRGTRTRPRRRSRAAPRSRSRRAASRRRRSRHVLEADAVLERLDERPERLVGDQDAVAARASRCR